MGIYESTQLEAIAAALYEGYLRLAMFAHLWHARTLELGRCQFLCFVRFNQKRTLHMKSWLFSMTLAILGVLSTFSPIQPADTSLQVSYDPLAMAFAGYR